jgi:hypothetical protein
MITFGGQSVGTSSVKLVDNVTGASTLVITNGHATNVLYVGNSSSVTTANGCPVPPNQVITLRQVTGGSVWVIASGASTPAGFAVGNEFG